MSKTKIHELKCVAPHFENIKKGAKTFEFRIDDRGFKINDVVYLYQFYPNMKGNGYTGEYIAFQITHLLKIKAVPFGFTGTKLFDCVIMSFKNPQYNEK